MHARITHFDVRVEDIEKLNTYFTDTVGPTYSAMPGYKGALSFVDRANGNWESITFWDTEAALQASEEAANQLRQSAKADLMLGGMTVNMYEVATDLREPRPDQPLAAKQPAREAEASRH